MQQVIRPEWEAVAAWATGRIEELRQKNDGVALDITQTTLIRGEIRALKALLDLPEALRRARVGEQLGPHDAPGY